MLYMSVLTHYTAAHRANLWCLYGYPSSGTLKYMFVLAIITGHISRCPSHVKPNYRTVCILLVCGNSIPNLQKIIKV